MSQPTLTNYSADYALLIRWTVYSPTIVYRFVVGDRGVTITGGTYTGYYEPQLVSADMLDERYGENPEPQIIWPRFSFSICRENADDETMETLITRINTYYDTDQTVEVFLCNGVSCSSSDLVFSGTVKADGIEYDEEQITITATCALERYDVEIPSDVFVIDDEKGDPDAAGEPIPIIYGNWDDNSARYWIPAKILERRTEIVVGAHSVQVQFCKPTTNGLYAVDGYVRWTRGGGDHHGFEIWGGQYPILIGSTADGTAVLNNSTAADAGSQKNVWQQGDQVFMERPHGNADADGYLIEDPVDIIYDVLKYYAGVPSAGIGDTITPGSGSQLSTGLKFRGFIDRKQKAITGICASLCRDAGLLLYVDGNKFELMPHPVFHWEKNDTVDAVELTPKDVTHQVKHRLRPAKWDQASVVVRYKRNPSSGDYTESTGIYSLTGSGDPLEIESDWIYRDVDAEALVSTISAACSPSVRMIEATVPLRGLQLGLADTPTGGATRYSRLLWTGGGITSTYFYLYQVRRSADHANAQVAGIVRMMDTYRALVGNDSLPEYSSATAGQKRTYGWVTDDDGYVDSDTTRYSDIYNRTD